MVVKHCWFLALLLSVVSMKVKEFGPKPLSFTTMFISPCPYGRGVPSQLNQSFKFHPGDKGKDDKRRNNYIYRPGFWLTRRLCGCWGQSLGNQARDCGCFSTQWMFALEFHHPLPGTTADHRVTWFHWRGEKMSFLCKITFSTTALLDMKVNKCLNYSK